MALACSYGVERWDPCAFGETRDCLTSFLGWVRPIACIDDGLLRAGQKVGVRVERRVDAAMPEPFLQDLRINPTTSKSVELQLN